MKDPYKLKPFLSVANKTIITGDNIQAIFIKAKNVLKNQNVKFPRRFASVYGDGNIYGNGSYDFDSWNDTPIIYTIKEL